MGLLDGIFLGLVTALQAVTSDSMTAFWEQLKHIPGLGVVLVFGGLLITGALVSNVVVHEFAHHFGWSDEDIATIDRWWE